MTPRLAIQFGSAGLASIGVALLVATASIATALGAVNLGAIPGGADPASTAFWFQLTFMRLFGTALIGFGAFLLWLQARLTDAETTSLAQALSLVFGGLALVTLVQQIAIWNTNAGWAIAGVLVLATAVLAIGAARGTRESAV